MLTKEQLAVAVSHRGGTQRERHTVLPQYRLSVRRWCLQALPPEDEKEQSPGMGAVLWTDEQRIYVMALSGAF